MGARIKIVVPGSAAAHTPASNCITYLMLYCRGVDNDPGQFRDCNPGCARWSRQSAATLVAVHRILPAFYERWRCIARPDGRPASAVSWAVQSCWHPLVWWLQPGKQVAFRRCMRLEYLVPLRELLYNQDLSIRGMLKSVGSRPTAVPNSRDGRGRRAYRSNIGRVPFTMSISVLPGLSRGVSCLPGARPGGFATVTVEGSYSCRDSIQGAAAARFLRVRRSCIPARPLTMRPRGVLCRSSDLEQERVGRCVGSRDPGLAFQLAEFVSESILLRIKQNRYQMDLNT
jgi:hypothetical protein